MKVTNGLYVCLALCSLLPNIPVGMKGARWKVFMFHYVISKIFHYVREMYLERIPIPSYVPSIVYVLLSCGGVANVEPTFCQTEAVMVPN